MDYDEYCKDMNKRELFSNCNIVYIPFKDVLIQFGRWNVNGVVEELIDCEMLNEETISNFKESCSDELKHFRSRAYANPDSDI